MLLTLFTKFSVLGAAREDLSPEVRGHLWDEPAKGTCLAVVLEVHSAIHEVTFT